MDKKTQNHMEILADNIKIPIYPIFYLLKGD